MTGAQFFACWLSITVAFGLGYLAGRGLAARRNDEREPPRPPVPPLRTAWDDEERPSHRGLPFDD